MRSSRRLRLFEDFNLRCLEIPECEEEDSGDYVCTATNCHGVAEHLIKVIVGDAALSDVTLTEGDVGQEEADVNEVVNKSEELAVSQQDTEPIESLSVDIEEKQGLDNKLQKESSRDIENVTEVNENVEQVETQLPETDVPVDEESSDKNIPDRNLLNVEIETDDISRVNAGGSLELTLDTKGLF